MDAPGKRTASADVLRRLSFIRLLLVGAEQSSNQPPPFNTDSINRLHDVAEMFLALAVEHWDGAIPRDFMGYWDELERRTGHALAYRAAMQRVNKARVSLKHYGIQPAPAEVEHCVSTVRNLLVDETPVLFAVELEAATLARFVSGDRAARCVEAAESHWAAGRQAESMADLREGFDEVLAHFDDRMSLDEEERELGQYFSAPEKLRREIAQLLSAHRNGRNLPKPSQQEQRAWDQLEDCIADLDHRLTLIGLGVDQARYSRFVSITPDVRSFDGRRFYTVPSHWTWTEEQYFFCRDFVISTSLLVSAIDTTVRPQPKLGGESSWQQFVEPSAAEDQAPLAD